MVQGKGGIILKSLFPSCVSCFGQFFTPFASQIKLWWSCNRDNLSLKKYFSIDPVTEAITNLVAFYDGDYISGQRKSYGCHLFGLL